MVSVWCVLVFLQAKHITGTIKSTKYHRTLLQNLNSDVSPLRETLALTLVRCAAGCLLEDGCHSIGYNGVSCLMFRKTPSLQSPGVRFYEESNPMGPSPGNVNTQSGFEDECQKVKGYIYVRQHRLCYKVYDFHSKYPASAKTCMMNHGRLIVLSKDDAFEYILGVLRKEFQQANIWVGMWVDRSGNSQWSDGSTHVKQWADGDPPVTSVDCVYMVALRESLESSGLRADFCDRRKMFICEIPDPLV